MADGGDDVREEGWRVAADGAKRDPARAAHLNENNVQCLRHFIQSTTIAAMSTEH